MPRALILVALFATSASGTSAATLRARTLPGGTKAPAAVIVGRAQCGQRTWLLTDTSELVEVSPDGVTVHPVRGLAGGDDPWGLACVTSGALWTIAAPRALARLGPDGRVLERVALRLPRVALFGVGDALLFEQLPTVPGAPVLTTSPPARPLETRSWIGLVSRRGASREEELMRSFVNCGLGRGGLVPCWFADEPRITLSDGADARSLTISFPPSVDSHYPIWDVALAGPDRAWVLLAALDAATGRRAGGRLSVVDDRGAEQEHLDLRPAARLILSATPARCLLLNVDGNLTEVSRP